MSSPRPPVKILDRPDGRSHHVSVRQRTQAEPVFITIDQPQTDAEKDARH